MRISMTSAIAALVLATAAPAAEAATVEVIGGTVTFAFDDDLTNDLGFRLDGVSFDVEAVPTAGSITVPINGPSHPRPSALSFDPADIRGTADGAIETRGLLFFERGDLVLGDFTLRRDGPGLLTVIDNAALGGRPFLHGVVTSVGLSGPERIGLEADLSLAAAFADVLEEAFPDRSLEGLPVGTLTVDAIVTPIPGAFVLAATGFLGLVALRRQARRRGDDGVAPGAT